MVFIRAFRGRGGAGDLDHSLGPTTARINGPHQLNEAQRVSLSASGLGVLAPAEGRAFVFTFSSCRFLRRSSSDVSNSRKPPA